MVYYVTLIPSCAYFSPYPAERTINAARVNFATMYELYRLLRQDKPVLTPTDRNRIMSIIFECRKVGVATYAFVLRMSGHVVLTRPILFVFLDLEISICITMAG